MSAVLRASSAVRGRPAAAFGSIFFVNSFGTALYMSVSVLYFTQVIGFSAHRLGVGLSVAALVGLLGSVPAGTLVDLRGSSTVLVVTHLVRAVAFTLYAFSPSFPEFVVLASVIAVADRTAPPASQALLAELVPAAERVPLMARLRVWENVGFASALALSALALGVGDPSVYRVLVLANAGSFVAVAFVAFALNGRRRPNADVTQVRAALADLVRRDRRYLYLSGANAILSMNAALFAIGLPLWILTRTDLPRWAVPATMLANSAIVVAFQVRMSKRATTLPAYGRLLALSGIAFALSLVVLGLVTDRTTVLMGVGLVCAVVVFTVGEMQHAVGAWGSSLELAPEAARGQYLAVFNLGLGIQDVIGPVLATLLVTSGTIGVPVACAVFLAAGVLSHRLLSAPESAPPTPAAAPDHHPDAVESGEAA
ncbi:MFS transporter [Streptomyces sp. NBC_00536]|uniref:MFS transporter n=1 Tax=Streptomyces sp. NBC_00536 TaxID=2975769 RepID=UPI002E7FC1E8|nr:MFS transporter [Streptomyces sp. NBC_00536]WUC83280.1 MFS transporter [Streptomyces sp. NBC_00536]